MANDPKGPSRDPHPLDSLFDEEPFAPGGKTLGADGHVEGSGGFTPSPTPLAHTSAPFPRVQPETLELAQPPPAERQPPPVAYEQPSNSVRSAQREQYQTERKGRPVWGIITLVLASLGGWAVYLTLTHALPGQQAAVQTLRSTGGPLTINSEPSGAVVRIDGTDVGRTPYAADNLYPSGQEIPFTVTLKGYSTYSGTFRGGVTASVNAVLTR